jgi:hypothetical protein
VNLKRIDMSKKTFFRVFILTFVLFSYSTAVATPLPTRSPTTPPSSSPTVPPVKTATPKASVSPTSSPVVSATATSKPTCKDTTSEESGCGGVLCSGCSSCGKPGFFSDCKWEKGDDAFFCGNEADCPSCCTEKPERAGSYDEKCDQAKAALGDPDSCASGCKDDGVTGPETSETTCPDDSKGCEAKKTRKCVAP